LKQLSSSELDLPIRKPVVDVYKKMKDEADKHGSDPSELSLEDCVDLILALLKDNPATIIIDALDECDPALRCELLNALDKIIQDSPSIIKVLVSSRDDHDIVNRLDNSPNLYICAKDNSKDIENFVRCQVDLAIRDKKLLCGNVTGILKDYIIKTLIQKAEGMSVLGPLFRYHSLLTVFRFRLVSLHIQSLCNPQQIKTEENVKNALKRLPNELNKSYDIILEQISNSEDPNPAIAMKAMKWLLCARRPLSIAEFIAVITIDSGGDCLPLSNAEVLSICCNMVVLDVELEVFRFAHLSVQDYLEGRGEYNPLKIHAFALERCIDTCTLGLAMTAQESMVKQNAVFRRYAILYWPLHYQVIHSDELVETLKRKVGQFLLHSCDTKWTSVAGQLSREASSSPTTPLFLACYFWLLFIIYYLRIFEKVDWNQLNEDGNLGLYLAASWGQEAVVRLLLEKVADAKLKAEIEGMALQYAARNGHEAVVRLLLEEGANFDTEGGNGESVLDWAVRGGNEAIVPLLKKEADLDTKDDIGGAALHLTAEGGHEAAKEQIREMQRQILAWKLSDSFLVVKDEDYFDDACQELYQQVQRWVLMFSEISDMKPCQLVSEITKDKVVDRLDYAVLDGSDPDSYLMDHIKRRDLFMSIVMTMVWEYIFTRYLFGMDREQRQKLKSLEKTLMKVGESFQLPSYVFSSAHYCFCVAPLEAVNQWRAMSLTLLAKRNAEDTKAVVHLIFDTLSSLLPPPPNLTSHVIEQLHEVVSFAADLSIEMRTQRAEYVMLPALQPEYDENGNLVRKILFNATLMNERSGDTVSNEELEKQGSVVSITLFPLVVKKGDDSGIGDEEILVFPAQVLVAKQKKEKVVKSPNGDSSRQT